jgi:hypothetical protein
VVPGNRLEAWRQKSPSMGMMIPQLILYTNVR